MEPKDDDESKGVHYDEESRQEGSAENGTDTLSSASSSGGGAGLLNGGIEDSGSYATLLPSAVAVPGHAEAERPKRVRRRGCDCTSPRKRRRWGVCLLATGSVFLGLAALVHFTFPTIFKRLLGARIVITSMAQARRNPGWLSNEGGTETSMRFFFYNVTNPDDFLGGHKPQYSIVGPFAFKYVAGKAAISFSDDGKFVDYATNHGAIFLADKSVGPANTTLTVFNTAYATGVARKRSESNMLRVGVRNILRPVRDGTIPRLETDLPALLLGGWGKRQGDLARAFANMSAVLGGEAFAVRWARAGFGSDTRAEVAQLLNVSLEDAEYARFLLDTGVDLNMEARLALRLWEGADVYSFTSLNTADNTRKGLLAWVGSPATSLVQGFTGITETQVNHLKDYVTRLTASPMVEIKLVEAVGLGHKYGNRTLLAWRQYIAADVLGRLADEDVVIGSGALSQGYIAANGTSSLADLGAYLRLEANLTMDEVNARWGDVQKGECLLDVLTANKTYFEEHIVGIPLAWYSHDFTHAVAEHNRPLQTTAEECFGEAASPPWRDANGYIEYMANKTVKSLFKALVIDGNGGLVSRRTVEEIVMGHVEPLLTQAFGRDNPAAIRYSVLENDTDINGVALCASSADMENTLSGCELDEQLSSEIRKVYRKVTSRFYTGKSDLSRVGELALYEGSEQAPSLWPEPVQVTNGAAALNSTLQQGFSTGDQFPPLVLENMDHPPSLWVMRMKGPVPLRFDYVKDVDRMGIRLRRFVLSDFTLSSEHPFYLDSTADDMHGVLNVTRISTMPAYMTPSSSALPVELLSNHAAPSSDTHEACRIDVEPITGKPMFAQFNALMSGSLAEPAAGSYDVFYKDVYLADTVPYMFVSHEASVQPSMARRFRQQVYGSRRIVNAFVWGGVVVGVVLCALGVLAMLVATREEEDRQDTRGKELEIDEKKVEDETDVTEGGACRRVRGCLNRV